MKRLHDKRLFTLGCLLAVASLFFEWSPGRKFWFLNSDNMFGELATSLGPPLVFLCACQCLYGLARTYDQLWRQTHFVMVAAIVIVLYSTITSHTIERYGVGTGFFLMLAGLVITSFAHWGWHEKNRGDSDAVIGT